MEPKRKKIPVAILGATGAVGQTFITLLSDHPWFEIVAVAASERSAGKRYEEAVTWIQNEPLPKKIAEMVVSPCTPPLSCTLCFSGLDSSVAGEVEKRFAEEGSIVISNSNITFTEVAKEFLCCYGSDIFFGVYRQRSLITFDRVEGDTGSVSKGDCQLIAGSVEGKTEDIKA